MSEKKVEVYCFGEALGGFYSNGQGDLDEIGDFHLTWGGDASNVALAIQKLGHQSGFVGKVGNDFFGEGFLKYWNEIDVNTENVSIDRERFTGLYFIKSNDTNHQFEYRRKNSAAANINKEDIAKEKLLDAKIFHLSGITQAISENSCEIGFDLMNYFKNKGKIISYDLNYREKLWSKEYARSIYMEVLNKYANIFSLSKEEAEILNLPKEPEKAIYKLLSFNPDLVIFRLGEEGALIGNKDGVIKSSIFKTEVEDTVGAGDTFTAAIIAGYLEKMSLEKMLKFALKAAAFTCRKIGSVEGQPLRKELNL